MGRPALPYEIYIPTWTQTLGDLQAEGARVEARCSRCDRTDRVKLEPLIAEHGPLYSLWNRHPPCRVCGEPVWFKANVPGAAVHPMQMRDGHPPSIAKLHARWEAAVEAEMARADEPE